MEERCPNCVKLEDALRDLAKEAQSFYNTTPCRDPWSWGSACLQNAIEAAREVLGPYVEVSQKRHNYGATIVVNLERKNDAKER